MAARRVVTDLRRCLAAGAAAAIVGVGVGLGGCGGGHSAPHLGPGIGYHPTPPTLPSSVPAGSPLVVDLTNTGAVRPSRMVIARDGVLTALRWSSWGQTTARAKGSALIHICSPNCAAGYERTYPVTVTLSGLKHCDSHEFYASASVTLATVAGPRGFGAFIHAPCAAQSRG